METTLKKQFSLRPSEKTRGIIVDIISYLFVALFMYTAASKIMTFGQFQSGLAYFPYISKFNTIIAWLVPSVEILISILLIVPSTRKKALYASLALMIIFTVYLIVMVLSGSKLPCSCGGVISKLHWKEHIWFNLIFVILAFIGLKLYKE